MTLSGCLFPEPPEYKRPPRTTPILWAPDPPIYEILFVKSGERKRINVNLKSEDGGWGILAYVHLNYRLEGQSQQELGSAYMDPGTVDQIRQLRVTWQVPQRDTPGTCEQISLVVSHTPNFDDDHEPIDDEDAAVLTWWLSINDSLETLEDCPRITGGTP